MDYLQNHIWCSSSNWDGEHYDCRHLVSIEIFGPDKDDWVALIDEEAEQIPDDFSRRVYESMIVEGLPAHEELLTATISVKNFKPHVLKWLEDTVADRNTEECKKGWCIGSSEYRSMNISNMSVFFHRKRDAMAFIKKFSKYKKPIHYCQYFSDVRKKLNLKTMKYEVL